MVDARFHSRTGPYRLDLLAALVEADIVGGQGDLLLDDVAPLSTAQAGDIAFFDNRLYLEVFKSSQSSACVARPDAVSHAPAGMALLVCDNPYFAYALIAEKFYPPPIPTAAIHPTATIARDAELGAQCRVDAGAVIGAGAVLGAGCSIGPHAVIGSGVEMGAGCSIGAHVRIQYALLGSGVVVHPGVSIGQDGFGFATKAGRHHRVPQLGRVVIGDDVDIGANTTIDRGSGPDTVIGQGCMIDNLVQIGHNVVLGKGCVIVAQTGISGSTKLGDYVMVGGQAGLTGHLTIGSGAQVAAQSGVMRDVSAGEVVAGSPCVPVRHWHRQTVAVARLAEASRTKTPKSKTLKSKPPRARPQRS